MKKPPVAPLWLDPPPDLPGRLADLMALARDTNNPIRVFFRADDAGVPSKKFFQLLDIFAKHQTPLAVAVVPAWLTTARWREINSRAARTPDLWCWHQHGWSHQNHETQGKKSEFGESRPPEDIRADILAGRERLTEILGRDFTPAFTPPWNRCGPVTLELLKELGYHLISRSVGDTPQPPAGFPDVGVNVDIHTRKETEALAGWVGLWRALEAGLKSGWCGMMIHHQRMNKTAFNFLDLLLANLRQTPGIRLMDLLEMAEVDKGLGF